jgi:hypothetical protein
MTILIQPNLWTGLGVVQLGSKTNTNLKNLSLNLKPLMSCLNLRIDVRCVQLQINKQTNRTFMFMSTNVLVCNQTDA